jgi:DNA-binding transcriptional MerR regulator
MPAKRSAMSLVQSFTATEAARFCGLSLPMVNYLSRHRIVVPTTGRRRGRGIQRQYSFGDIVVMRVVARMLAGGVSVYRLRRGLSALRAYHPTIVPGIASTQYVVTDGQEVYLRHKTGVLELLANGQFSFAFVVELETVRREAVEFLRSRSDLVTTQKTRRLATKRLARSA